MVASLATTAVAADPETSTTTLARFDDGQVLQANHPITLQATVSTLGADFATDATMDFDATEPGAGECHGVTVDPANVDLLPDQRTRTRGRTSYTATYSGNATADRVHERPCSSSWFRPTPSTRRASASATGRSTRSGTTTVTRSGSRAAARS